MHDIPSSSSSSGQPLHRNKLPTVSLPDYRFDTLDEWKKARGIDPSTRIFQVHGAFPSVRRALAERGWVENEDPNSPFWDFKYAMRKKDLNIDLNDSKLDGKVVNYFSRNQEYTTKIRLCRNLENLVFLEDVTADTLVPRTYDLSSPGEVEAFVEHFKTNHCVSLLMGHVRRKGFRSFSEDIVQVAERVLKKKGKHLDDLLDETEGTDLTKISAVDWALLERVNLEQPTSRLPAYRRQTTGVKTKRRKKKKKASSDEKEVSEWEEDEEAVDETRKFLDKCLEREAQESLSGEHNLWIMKPASLSRGRGIFITNRLEEALDCAKGKEAMWMAQKYIERPLLIEGKKFDIRQWVLVTSWQQLGVWFYDDAYLRFSFDDFDASDQRNKLAHLTNYSVCKHAKNFEERRDETMMHSDDFAKFLKDLDGTDLWKEKIQPAMKRAVYLSLLSCQETTAQTSTRENSFELLGFDFMVDTAYNVWLLEINSSPDLSYSTSVTRELVKEVLPDVIKVTIDCEKMGLPSNKRPTWSKKYLSSIDSGRWEMLESTRRRKEIRASAKAVHGDQMSMNTLSLVGAPARIYKPKGVKRQLIPHCAQAHTAIKNAPSSSSGDAPASAPTSESSKASSSTNVPLSSSISRPPLSASREGTPASSSSSRSSSSFERPRPGSRGLRMGEKHNNKGRLRAAGNSIRLPGKGNIPTCSNDASVVSSARSVINCVSDASIEGLESECSTAENSVAGDVALSIVGEDTPLGRPKNEIEDCLDEGSVEGNFEHMEVFKDDDDKRCFRSNATSGAFKKQQEGLEGSSNFRAVRRLRRLSAFSRETSESTMATTHCSTEREDAEDDKHQSEQAVINTVQLALKGMPFHSAKLGDGAEKTSVGRKILLSDTHGSPNSERNESWTSARNSSPAESSSDTLRKSSATASSKNSARNHMMQRRVMPMSTFTVDFLG